MSWFKHSPPKYPSAQKHYSTPHKTSPATEKMMDEAKKIGPKDTPHRKSK